MVHERAFTSEEWLSSPMNYMVQNGVTFLRRHLVGPAAVLDFETLKVLSRIGGQRIISVT